MEQETIMEGSILLDTDVLVDSLRGHNKTVAFVNAHSARIILSSVYPAFFCLNTETSKSGVAN